MNAKLLLKIVRRIGRSAAGYGYTQGTLSSRLQLPSLGCDEGSGTARGKQAAGMQ